MINSMIDDHIKKNPSDDKSADVKESQDDKDCFTSNVVSYQNAKKLKKEHDAKVAKEKKNKSNKKEDKKEEKKEENKKEEEKKEEQKNAPARRVNNVQCKNCAKAINGFQCQNNTRHVV